MSRRFYDKGYARGGYISAPDPTYQVMVEGWVDRFGLESARVLEVGCGRGFLSGIVTDWTGLDLSLAAGVGLGRRFVAASASKLPFRSESFDAIWSLDALEHVPELERSLQEMCRVLRPGGVLMLRPAWFCRPWAAGGYEVRPYRDLAVRGKLIKASIPVRNALWFRLPGVLFRRLYRELETWVSPAPRALRYRRLTPNLEVFWQSDSDACASIDPHEVILWFRARGWTVLDRESFADRLSIRTGAVLARKPHREGAATS